MAGFNVFAADGARVRSFEIAMEAWSGRAGRR